MMAGINCANEAAKRKVKVFVQLSTGCVYQKTDNNGVSNLNDSNVLV
jgi:hypothetical protein